MKQSISLKAIIVHLLFLFIVINNSFAQVIDSQVLQQRKQMQQQGEALKAQQQQPQPQQQPSHVPGIAYAGSSGVSPNAGSIHVNRDLIIRDYTPEQLVNEIFVKGGGCASVSNVTLRSHGWDGSAWTDVDNRGLGYFTRGTSNFEMEDGLVLSTGGLVSIEGPNELATAVSSPYAGNYGDPDLSTIVPSVTNVSVLEFDFVPVHNVIQFKYVFASEEYAEFTNSSYNDVFGFFISGAGITGAQNIAQLPTTSTGSYAVSINNVNDGYRNTSSHNCPPGDTPSNSNYFVNTPGTYSFCNTLALIPEEVALQESMEFDGRTVVLTATATVVPCQTYHLKLAVGNVGDTGYQSGVFLEAQSFDLGSSTILNYGSDTEGMDLVYRGCELNKMVISRPVVDVIPFDVHLTYGGTATNGQDISLPDGSPLPAMVTIPAGQLSVDLFYKVNDVNSGMQTFTVTSDCPCGSAGYTKTLYIYDRADFDVTPYLSCPGANTGKILASVVPGSTGSGYYQASTDGGTVWNLFTETQDFALTNLTPGDYTVLVRDSISCHVTTFNQTVEEFTLGATTDQESCSNTFTMDAPPLFTGETGLWQVVSGTASIDDPQDPTTTVTLTGVSAVLRWTLTSSGCSISNDVTIKTSTLDDMADITLCAESQQPVISFTGANLDVANTTWTNSNPAIGLAASGTGAIPVFMAANDTETPIKATITVTPQATFGCTGTAKTFEITVNPVIRRTETEEICESDLPYTWRDITFPLGTVSGDFIYNRQTTLACDSIVTLQLTVHQINYDVKDTIICNGDSYDLNNAISNLQNTEVRFYLSANDTGAGIQPLVSPTVTTTYYVKAFNPMGCILEKTIEIVVVNKPAVAAIPAVPTMCEGEKISIPVPAVTDEGTPVFSQMWLLGENPFDLTTAVSAADNNQTLQYIAENACGTSSSNAVVLSVVARIPFTAPDYEVCYDNSIELQAPESDAYLWMPGMSTEQNPTVYPAETTLYTLRLTTAACSFDYPVMVTVLPLPETVEVKQTGMNKVAIFAGKPYTYRLDENAPVSATEFNGVPFGLHFLEITDHYGCMSKQTFSTRGFTVPSFFTPNGDGKNDMWVIEDMDTLPEAKLYIYDRAGKLLDTLDETRPLWNGEFNGQELPSTDYWYMLEVPEFRETFTGNFTLKR